MFGEVIETLMLFAFVFEYQIVCMSIFQERYGNSILFIEVLFDDKIGKRFIDALKFGVEGTIVERYLFDDRRAFNIVMVCSKL